MDPAASKSLLEAEGYRVVFRRDAWSECLVRRGDERWRGCGDDDDDALEDALRQMFPSHAARSLLARSAELASASPSPPETAETAPANETHRPPEEALEPIVAAGGAANEVHAPDVAPPVRVVPLAARVLDPRADVALDAIDALVDEIASREDELASAVPVRQRLVITGWIAEARRAQDAFPEEERVRSMVARVAGRLSKLCRVWWCGSVRALQADRRPEAVLSELPYDTDVVPRDWSDVAELAGSMLSRMDRDDARAGRDELGWSDADRLIPGPRDPDALLREVITAVEAAAGPAEAFPPRSMPDAKLLARCVARLRWLRGCAVDGAGWAYAMGRCRWWVAHDGAKYAEAAVMLDPAYRPESSWASLFASPSKDRERRRLVKEVFTSAPAVKDRPDASAIAAWLGRALPLADTHHAQIVAAVEPFRDVVLALDAASLPVQDRRARRRLLLLQRDLGAGVAVPDAPAEAEAEAECASHDIESVAAEEARPPMLDAVRHRTEGTRALFISNRNDPMLQDRLVRALGFSELDWCEADVKRAQAAEQKVSAGGYDFVLAATGFLSHSVDGRLSRVCRARKIPYVRVERGRPLTCVRSLARDLGLGS